MLLHAAQVDVFAVPQFERPCPEFKHHPDRVLGGVMSAPSCRAVLLATQPWSQPVAFTRAWCLYETFLARCGAMLGELGCIAGETLTPCLRGAIAPQEGTVTWLHPCTTLHALVARRSIGKELQVLMMDEQPGPDARSPRLPLARMAGGGGALTATHDPSGAGGAPGVGRLLRGAAAAAAAGGQAAPPEARVVQVVDAALAALDITRAATRVKVDMDFILQQVHIDTILLPYCM